MTLKKKMILGLVITLVIAQFFQPKKNQSNFVSIALFLEETQGADKDFKILRRTRSCI